MKLLIVSDEESAALWDYYQPGRLKEYDLIISCGDLKAKYLSFLVTMARCPLLYVHGNHDTDYVKEPPGGCDCIDDMLIEYNGLRILGLGGCRKYHPGAHQYTERQMRKRIRRLRWHLWRSGGVDIVVTHTPPEGVAMRKTGPTGALNASGICWMSTSPCICSMDMSISATAWSRFGSASTPKPRWSTARSAMRSPSRTGNFRKSGEIRSSGGPDTGILIRRI